MESELMRKQFLRRVFHNSLTLLVAIVALLIPSQVQSYVTQFGWPKNIVIFYASDPNIGATLVIGVSTAQTLIDAAGTQWSNASLMRVSRANTYPNGNIITTRNLLTNPICGLNDSVPAGVCYTTDASGRNLTSFVLYLNSSQTYRWNTSGYTDQNVYPKQVDFLTIILHEMGHFISLGHDCVRDPSAIMCVDYTTKQTLVDDDKNGATQINGPFTGFETNNTVGIYSTLAYSRDVTGYNQNNNLPPALAPSSQELGVPVTSGSRYTRIFGYAQACYSYAYFRLFSNIQDRNANPIYFTIRPGAKLVYSQYNYEQKTMGVDFEMTDGSTFRETFIKDANGVYGHPAFRGVYPLGEWRTHTFDLSRLSGKQIRQWMLAFDSGDNPCGPTGKFRGYFDNIKIDEQQNLAVINNATASASTYYNDPNVVILPPSKVLDNISHRQDQYEWASTETNPWIQLTWSSSQKIDKIKLFDRPVIGRSANAGTLTFSDGSSISVTGIPDNGDAKEISFSTKTVTWVKFQVTSGIGDYVGLAEFQILTSQ